jgi:hypothetical protein
MLVASVLSVVVIFGRSAEAQLIHVSDGCRPAGSPVAVRVAGAVSSNNEAYQKPGTHPGYEPDTDTTPHGSGAAIAGASSVEAGLRW